MNKTRIAASTALTALLLTSCGGDETYRYEISGSVQDRQIGYDCPGEDTELEPVAFTRSSGGGGRSSGSGSRSSGRSSHSGGDSTTSGGSGAKDGTSGRSRQAPSRPKEPVGAKLTKAPKKPRKISKIPSIPLVLATDRCEAEHYLYLRADGDLYVQEVRAEDYRRCDESDPFPACTADD